MVKGKIWIADVLILVVSLGVIIGLVSYMGGSKLQLSPEEISRSDILFWFEDEGKPLLVDDSLDFSSPQVYNVHDGATIFLGAGDYYLKIEHKDYNEIKTLTIQSPLTLKLVSLQEGVFGVVQTTGEQLYVTVQTAEGDESFMFESREAKSG